MSTDLARLRTPPMRLQPGQEWWTDNRWQLLARLRADTDRGLIQPLALRELAPGFYGALVVRLKPRPPAWRKPLMIGAVVVLAAGLAVQVALWFAALTAYRLGFILAPLLPLLLLAGRSASGHRVMCVGLHCPGCKG